MPFKAYSDICLCKNSLFTHTDDCDKWHQEVYEKEDRKENKERNHHGRSEDKLLSLSSIENSNCNTQSDLKVSLMSKLSYHYHEDWDPKQTGL